MAGKFKFLGFVDYKVSAMIFLLTVLGCLAAYIFFTSIRQPDVGLERLSQELNLIPAMPEASPMGEIEFINKGLLVGAVQDYAVKKPSSLVVEFYLSTAPKYGWRYIGTNKIGNEEVLRFCKKNLSLAVDVISPTASATEYSSGVRWARTSGDPNYCRS